MTHRYYVLLLQRTLSLANTPPVWNIPLKSTLSLRRTVGIEQTYGDRCLVGADGDQSYGLLRLLLTSSWSIIPRLLVRVLSRLP